MSASGIPTILVVVGDGTVETTYYSDGLVRLIVAEPDLIIDMPSDAVSEQIVFDLEDARLPASASKQIKALLSKPAEASV